MVSSRIYSKKVIRQIWRKIKIESKEGRKGGKEGKKGRKKMEGREEEGKQGRKIVCEWRSFLVVLALLFQPCLSEAGGHYGKGIEDQLEPECSKVTEAPSFPQSSSRERLTGRVICGDCLMVLAQVTFPM